MELPDVRGRVDGEHPGLTLRSEPVTFVFSRARAHRLLLGAALLTAADAVREGARKTFDGLPVTLRTLRRSRPYALPRALQPPPARSGDPDLTYVAALDRTQLRPAADRLPRRTDNTTTRSGRWPARPRYRWWAWTRGPTAS